MAFVDRVGGYALNSFGGLLPPDLVDLAHTHIKDEDIECLSGWQTLEYLILSDTQVGDAGLAHLSALNNLKALDLSGTQITDAGLVHLKGLKNLKSLSLEATWVTDAGVKKLREALPNCVVYEPSAVEFDGYFAPAEGNPSPE